VVDIFDRIKTSHGGPLGQYIEFSHGYFTFPKLEGPVGPHMMFRGKEVLNWSLNNYLGLANHPEVIAADAEAAKQWGMAAPMGARMLSGNTKYHEEFERNFAKWVGKEDAFLLNFGYQGMISIIDNLVGPRDVVVYDAECHACIIDGLMIHRGKGGKRFVYPHNDMARCRKQLEHATKLADQQGGGVLLITEGVFGMRGDLGQLDEICAMKKDFQFRILVDDAHGLGTMGKRGTGTPEHFGVEDQVDIHFCTFAKSMAGIGAFVASDHAIIDCFRYNMRSQIYAKSLPMPMVLGGMKRFELIQNHPEYRERLWEITHALQNGLREGGFNIGNTVAPVTPIFLKGGPAEATNLIVDLRENFGLFCSAVAYPVVPKGELILRVIPTAAHTMEDVKFTLDVLGQIRGKLQRGEYCRDIPYDKADKREF